MSFKRSLPSINALVTLEAAMRLKSFTLAARELNVTQAAVSRQVRLLEEEFGFPLFQRGHRRVVPTVAGEILGMALFQALEGVQDAVDQVRRFRDEQTLTVGATLAFSYYWLLPKLHHFREEHPALKIRVVSQDEVFNLKSGDVDVVMRFGIPPFEDGKTVASVRDRFYPICSPAFATRFDGPPAPSDLLSLPLIGSDVIDPTWMEWPDWFGHFGLGKQTPRPALQFNHTTDSIAAALGGQGVAMGWDSIVASLLARGELVRLGEKVLAEGTYNAVLPFKRPASAAADAFIEWIRANLREVEEEVSSG